MPTAPLPTAPEAPEAVYIPAPEVPAQPAATAPVAPVQAAPTIPPAAAPTPAAPVAAAGAAASTATATASSTLASLKVILTITGLMLRGRLREGFDLMTALQPARLIALISLPISFGLYLTALAYQGTRAYNSFISEVIPFGLGRLHLEFSDIVTIFVAGLLVSAIVMGAALAVMRLCFALRHTPVTLPQLTGVYATGITPLVIVLPPAVLLTLIPWSGLVSLVLILVLITAVFTMLLSFLSNYIGIARLGRFTTSAAVPYVALTMVAAALVAIILTFLVVR